MKVYYHSALNDVELIPDGVLRAIPCKSYLELHKEKAESPYELLYNGTMIDPEAEKIPCNEKCELVIRQNGKRNVYSVRPLVRPLTAKYAKAYEQFSFEHRNLELDVISGIQLGYLKLYAVEQSSEVYDWTDVFNRIELAFRSFKTICENPKSHLRAVNEVRPIETVKRIGYESIPYLAAHSEDWLARTASGLKPARLFSRVEDDEYQIYENRVVKTLIDLLLGFLRKTEKQLRDQRDQLSEIMDSGVQTGSFGFDVNFQKAVSELMSSDGKGETYCSSSYDKANDLQKRAYTLLKRYRSLRQTRLYRYLKKSKPVLNPLNETNILVLNKYYSEIFKLWKTIHNVVAPKITEDESRTAFDDICDYYQKYCATLCGYAAHVLGFELKEGRYERTNDRIELDISCAEDGTIHAILRDKEPRSISVPAGIELPIEAGTASHGFFYDGQILTWPNHISEDEIDSFCGLFKTRESRGKEQSEEKRKYTALKRLLEQKQRSYGEPGQASCTIIPTAVELSAETRSQFKAAMEVIVQDLREKNQNERFVVAMPVCNEDEQRITEYAREDGQLVSLLPLTMFDINSFRRLQNILYGLIIELDKGRCPNCGGVMRQHDNQSICDSCSQLTLTRTICPNPKCRHKYLYMGYDVSALTLQKMKDAEKGNFFQWDSMYQYKNIVNMTTTSGKVRAICPRCHQSKLISP